MIVDEELELGGCDSIKDVAVYKRTGGDIHFVAGRDIWLHDLIANRAEACEPEWVDAEHRLFILYTSGSTGIPKGVQHSSSGYLLWAALTMKWVFDIKTDKVYWCTADISWITCHTYIAYGPTAVGATQVILEGMPTFPNVGRFWDMIQLHKVTIFYTAPTAIRSLIKAADAEKISILPNTICRLCACSARSLNRSIRREAWMWYHKHIGQERCPVVDAFWQTEAGGHMISPLPGTKPLVPGSCTLPLPGIQAVIVDESGNELPDGHGDILVVKRLWPSMIRAIWNNPKRFKSAYFPPEFDGKLYLAGDGAIHNKDTGYFTITGHIDDVLNVSGHRIGTMEIESGRWSPIRSLPKPPWSAGQTRPPAKSSAPSSSSSAVARAAMKRNRLPSNFVTG